LRLSIQLTPIEDSPADGIAKFSCAGVKIEHSDERRIAPSPLPSHEYRGDDPAVFRPSIHHTRLAYPAQPGNGNEYLITM
jgi:hypothetical protein